MVGVPALLRHLIVRCNLLLLEGYLLRDHCLLIRRQHRLLQGKDIPISDISEYGMPAYLSLWILLLCLFKAVSIYIAHKLAIKLSGTRTGRRALMAAICAACA